jgi:AraC-like DNA-binding protein
MFIPVVKDEITEHDARLLDNLGNCLQLRVTEPGFGVKQLAHFLGISTTHLNRQLLELTGRSPGQLIRHFRLHIARQLLLNQESVSQVARKSGFTAAANFCRSFIKEFGCSPAQYKGRPEPLRWKLPLSDDDFEHLLRLARQQSWLSQLLKLIIQSFGEEFPRVEELASALYFSDSTLNRHVKDTFGITPRRFIRDLRLQYASELLTEGKAPADVTYSSGFFDPAHFSRCFKSVFGMPPSAYTAARKQEKTLAWLETELMVQNDK